MRKILNLTSYAALLLLSLCIFTFSLNAEDEPRPPEDTPTPEPTTPPTPTPCPYKEITIVESLAVIRMGCTGTSEDPGEPYGELIVTCEDGKTKVRIEPEGAKLRQDYSISECVKTFTETRYCWDGPTVEYRCGGTMELGDTGLEAECICENDEFSGSVGNDFITIELNDGVWGANCQTELCPGVGIEGSICEDGYTWGIDLDLPKFCPLLGREANPQGVKCRVHVGGDQDGNIHCGGSISY